jgi:carboxyl-terminal processing protease
MSYARRCSISAAACIMFVLSLHAQTISLDRRIFILSKTYATIPVQFAHWRTASYKPLQLDSIYQIYLKRTLETESRKDFAFLMREFIALLNNGHSWYNDTKAFGAYPSMGFTWLNINGFWTVTRSSVEGLLPGDVVMKIEGKPVDDYFKELARYFTASDERARQARLVWTLASIIPNNYTAEIQTKSGSVKKLAVDRQHLTITPQVVKTESRWLEPNRIGYIKIPSFNSPEFERDALVQLKEYIHAQAIIVDVRGNGGGSTPSRLTAALMNKPYRWWTEGTPVTVGLFRYYSEARPSIELNEYFRNAQLTWQSEEVQPDSGAFNGAIIILADRNTGSAAEDFTVPFKDNGRGLIIGEATNGSTGQPYMYNFGDGISIGIGTKRAYMPNGSEFEGVGIMPDIRVPVQREDLYAGKDRALERAIVEANNLKGIR